ncbi:MAG: sigma-70 family RNA polymerase sigma factor [Gemmatimonadota bacterium]
MSVDWAAVYAATYEDLVRFLYRKVWDGERAQDLAQEAFVRALEHAPENPRSWLFTVAGNLARDEARAAIRRKRHLTLLVSEQESWATGPDAASELERRERRHSVRRALERLVDRDRDILLLWDAGLSYAEIAAQTGLAKGAIGTTLARARRRLVESYEELEERDAAPG